MALLPDLAARLLDEIRGGKLSTETVTQLTPQGAGYTATRLTHVPMDQYGDPIVPGAWPVNPPGRLA